ncbi:50S ribosomal protein L5 [Megasphaera sp.]|uniref:large ribosomal subunit protein uL5 n=1 Tax=Megasphaera sp. TaxID=2023260 RepID=UPI00257D2F88|nr:50S ribosomal protein L5 [Megasphaera sp.]
MARLKEFYKSDVAPAMMSKFGYKSVMQIPKLDKVVINVGCGELKDNPKMLDAIVTDLGKITGQKAVACKAHKSVANFKLREGMIIGAKVTLRGERMYEFVDKLFNIALRGMDITFVTTARTDEEAKELLTLMGAPFEK